MKESSIKNRIVGLDWLRGICALSIMFFHYIGIFDSTNLLNKLGIYGVSIFFILSGLSMAIVYNHFIKDFKTSTYFFIRRLFRIIPLYFVICLLVIIPGLVTGRFNWHIILLFLLNITTLFGFIKPDAYLATGAWSIGNEMVYYSFTPIIILLYNYKKAFGNLILAVSIIIGVYFAFFRLHREISLVEQWSIYINPFNNLFLFVIGISIYYNFSNLTVSKWTNYLILITSITIFSILPFNDQMHICTGINRIIYSLLCTVIVLCFYKMKNKKLTLAGKLFEQFGIATYGVYLLHPITIVYLSYFINSTIISIPLSIILTIGIALISFYFFESKLIQIGKKYTTIASQK